MKRFLCAVCDLLAVVFLTGTKVLADFSRRKLGLVRWLNYYNMKYRKELPVDILKYLAAVLVCLLIVLVLVSAWRKKSGIWDKIMLGAMACTGVYYLGFTILKNVQTCKTYYFAMPLIGAAALMLILRNFIAFSGRKVDDSGEKTV